MYSLRQLDNLFFFLRKINIDRSKITQRERTVDRENGCYCNGSGQACASAARAPALHRPAQAPVWRCKSWRGASLTGFCDSQVTGDA